MEPALFLSKIMIIGRFDERKVLRNNTSVNTPCMICKC